MNLCLSSELLSALLSPSTEHMLTSKSLASFMHYTLILSPKGQYLLKLIDNANKLIPYMAIRQTLKIGNIATMMSGLVKIILTKISIGSLTNWIGLTATENDGMNLLQQYVSRGFNRFVLTIAGSFLLSYTGTSRTSRAASQKSRKTRNLRAKKC